MFVVFMMFVCCLWCLCVAVDPGGLVSVMVHYSGATAPGAEHHTGQRRFRRHRECCSCYSTVSSVLFQISLI